MVIVEDYYFSNGTSQPGPQSWVNNGLFTLNTDNKAILESNEWPAALTDDIMNAAQTMLADQFNRTARFQNTNAGLCMMLAVEPDEFIQIMCDGNGNWVMTSMIGCKHPGVQTFDSLYYTLSPEAPNCCYSSKKAV